MFEGGKINHRCVFGEDRDVFAARNGRVGRSAEVDAANAQVGWAGLHSNRVKRDDEFGFALVRKAQGGGAALRVADDEVRTWMIALRVEVVVDADFPTIGLEL